MRFPITAVYVGQPLSESFWGHPIVREQILKFCLDSPSARF
jgi:hypothetical protein